jgi:hypothetical protein
MCFFYYFLVWKKQRDWLGEAVYWGVVNVVNTARISWLNRVSMNKICECIQKFRDWVDKEIYMYVPLLLIIITFKVYAMRPAFLHCWKYLQN